jgi:hypothetical protein
MNSMTFIGLDIHKKTISYCAKSESGKVDSGQRDRMRKMLKDSGHGISFEGAHFPALRFLEHP